MCNGKCTCDSSVILACENVINDCPHLIKKPVNAYELAQLTIYYYRLASNRGEMLDTYQKQIFNLKRNIVELKK